MTANKPNAATRAWAGKNGQRDPNNWKPHQGPFKVIKLRRNEGVAPEMTEVNCRIDQRWSDF